MTRTGKFKAEIYFNGRARYIGTFETAKEASCSYTSVKTALEEAKRNKPGVDLNEVFESAKADLKKKKLVGTSKIE